MGGEFTYPDMVPVVLTHSHWAMAQFFQELKPNPQVLESLFPYLFSGILGIPCLF